MVIGNTCIVAESDTLLFILNFETQNLEVMNTETKECLLLKGGDGIAEFFGVKDYRDS